MAVQFNRGLAKQVLTNLWDRTVLEQPMYAWEGILREIVPGMASVEPDQLVERVSGVEDVGLRSQFLLGAVQATHDPTWQDTWVGAAMALLPGLERSPASKLGSVTTAASVWKAIRPAQPPRSPCISC